MRPARLRALHDCTTLALLIELGVLSLGAGALAELADDTYAVSRLAGLTGDRAQARAHEPLEAAQPQHVSNISA
jgi:hypothetical protein